VEDCVLPQENIMSLKEALLGFIDNVSLPAIFSRKAENLKELRQPLVKGIANAKRQFENGQTRAPHRWWKLSNDVVALTVKVRGNVFRINGVETNHIQSDRFADFLDKFTAAVDAGDFDDELRHEGAGDVAVKIPKAKPAAAKPAQTSKPAATKAPATVEKPTALAPSEATLAPKPKSTAAKAARVVTPKPKREAVDVKAAQTEKPAATTVPTAVETPAAPAPAKSTSAPKPQSSAAKAVKAVAPKPKRKPVDAKTAYARATKAAATRAANKAQKAGSAGTTDES
jgi:hypothetical protein